MSEKANLSEGMDTLTAATITATGSSEVFRLRSRSHCLCTIDNNGSSASIPAIGKRAALVGSQFTRLNYHFHAKEGRARAILF